MSTEATREVKTKHTIPPGILEALKLNASQINTETNVPMTGATSNTEELNLQPYEWASSDRDGGFSLRVWSHTRKTEIADSKRVLLRIEDYEPFCRIELPSVVGGKTVKWNVEALKVYTQWLRYVLSNHTPTKITYKEMYKMYWHNVNGEYQKVKYPFLVCYFQTDEAMRHCVQLINKQGYDIQQLGFIKSRVWETSISAIHRLVTDVNVGYGQWFRVQGHRVDELDKISTNPLEYIASYKTLSAMTPEETQGWITNPLVAAVDLECYSANHRAMCNQNYATDVVFQASYILQRLGDPKSRQQYLLALGECGDIPGATVMRFDHEIRLIDGLCDLIKQTDPTLILGYNIYKFDLPYMDARMKLYMRDWKTCGLIKDQGTKIDTKTWKSSAYGFMNISTLEAEGRLCIDMFPIIKRDHKLDRYTLDFVSKHFLDRGKHDVTPKQMFENYKECCDASEAKDSERIAKAREEMARVGRYCLEDSILCIDLLEKLNIWIMLIELATIVQVTVMSIFTRGQQIRVQNQVYQFAYREDFVLDERAGSRDGFAGGAVDDPIVGKYKNLLIFDFASLYPSIIRAFNICFSTLVPPESTIPDEMCHILAWTETDVETGKVKYFRYRFIKQEFFHGFLPRICDHLTKERNKTRAMINPKNDVFTNVVLNQRQLGLKVSNNSIFGALGVKEGRMPLPEGARSITAMGRQLKGMAAGHVREKHQGIIVYGDTDSIMVDLNIQDPHQCVERGEALAEEFKSIFPQPLELTFERAYSIAFFIKKKKYAGVPLAIAKLSDGDCIERVPFLPEYNNPNLILYKITMMRDGKTVVNYVGVPSTIPIAGVAFNMGDRADVISVPKEGPLAKYRVTLKQTSSVLNEESGITVETTNTSVVEVDGRKFIAGIPLDFGGKPNTKELMKKGIVLARRDNCIWIREAYLRVLLAILFDKPLEHTIDIINEEIMKIMTRQVPFDKLMVTREIGSNYKPNSTYPLKLFADELRKQGHVIQGGERIDYVFVRCMEQRRNEKQGYKMRLPEHYWANCYNEPIDRLHYVEKIMKNPIDQILYLGYKAQIDASEQAHAPPIKRRGKIYTYLKHDYINTWVKMIKVKEDLNNMIKNYRPHFNTQDPIFSYSFFDQPSVTLEVVA